MQAIQPSRCSFEFSESTRSRGLMLCCFSCRRHLSQLPVASEVTPPETGGEWKAPSAPLGWLSFYLSTARTEPRPSHAGDPTIALFIRVLGIHSIGRFDVVLFFMPEASQPIAGGERSDSTGNWRGVEGSVRPAWMVELLPQHGSDGASALPRTQSNHRAVPSSSRNPLDRAV